MTNLFAGTEVTPMTAAVKIAPNKNLKAGTVLGLVDEQTYYDVVTAKGEAAYILANDTVTGETAEETVAYKTGVFAEAALHFAAGDNIGNHREQLRKYNIHVKAEV